MLGLKVTMRKEAGRNSTKYLHREVMPMSIRVLTLAMLSAMFCIESAPSNAADLSRKPFSRWGQSFCAQSGNCDVNFGVVPASHAYEIKFVSCYLSIGNVNGKPLYWYLHVVKPGKDPVGRIHLRPNSLGTTTTEHTYNATENGFLRAPAGATMTVAMTRDTSTAGGIPFLECTMTGEDVTLG